MARASYIWVVIDPAKGTNPVSTWTVKHEMITWLDAQPDETLSRMEVLRYPDGTRHKWIHINAAAKTLVERIEPEWFMAWSLAGRNDIPQE